MRIITEPGAVETSVSDGATVVFVVVADGRSGTEASLPDVVLLLSLSSPVGVVVVVVMAMVMCMASWWAWLFWQKSELRSDETTSPQG